MPRLGFVGAGAITSAIVRGLKGSELRAWPILVSPRNAETAARLASDLPGVEVAPGNQELVDGSDIVVLAVRPQIAESVIRPLRFHAGHQVLSLVAATSLETVRGWTGIEDVTRAIPLAFVEHRRGITPILPPNERVAEIFRALGDCIEVSEVDAFDAYAAASALSSPYFGIVETAHRWLIANGLPADGAERYLRSLFGNLGDTLRTSSTPLTELPRAHATRGGLNELAHELFMRNGGGAAIELGLTAVLERLRDNRG